MRWPLVRISSATRMALLTLVSSVWLASASTSTDAAGCFSIYGAADKASAASILKARYGDAFMAFDLDHPGMVGLIISPKRDEFMETAKGRVKIDPREFTWLAIRRTSAAQAETPNLPHDIIVAFRRCSHVAVGFEVLR